MAKGQVTDDDLASGLKGFGGLGSLGGASTRPVRDNPFRDTRAEPPRPVVVPPTAEPTPAPMSIPEVPKLEIVSSRNDRVEGEGITPPSLSEPAPAKPRARKQSTAPTAKLLKPTVTSAPATAEHREKKTELYTERVTVLLDAELRDGAEALAKELQRRRTEKGERITANTIMRVALRELLETFVADTSSTINSEDDFQRVLRLARAAKP